MNDGTIKLAGGVLSGMSGIDNEGTISGFGTVLTGTALAQDLHGNGSVTAGGGTLTLVGTVENSNFTIDPTTASTLTFNGTADSVDPISIDNANQTLQIGAGAHVTITGAESITNGTITLSGGTLVDDRDGLTIGSGATLSGFGTAGDVTLAGGTITQSTGTLTLNSITGNGMVNGTITDAAITAQGGTLDLTGSIAGTSTLAIDLSTTATLKIDGTVVTSDAININQGTQTLEVGGGSASLTLGAAESVSNTATLKLDGGTLTDAAGVTIGSGSNLSGQGVIAANTTVDGSGQVTATGGVLDLRGAVATNPTVDTTGPTDFQIANVTTSTLKFEGNVGTGTSNPTITFDGTQNGLGKLDLTAEGNLANFHGVVANFEAGTTITVSGNAGDTIELNANGHQLDVFNSSHVLQKSVALAGDYTGAGFTLVNDGSGTDAITTTAVCFLAGTLITTPTGPVAVEDLAIGDLVVTVDGRAVSVKWLGRQTLMALFGMPEGRRPVCIAAGALGDNLPNRDLCLTSDHALLIDDGLVRALVQAGALVNDSTIRRIPLEELGERLVVFHIETKNHEVILAEGTPAETFVDNVSRRHFDNFAEYEALYGGGSGMIEELPYPRAMSARQVPPSLRARIARRCDALWSTPLKRYQSES